MRAPDVYKRQALQQVVEQYHPDRIVIEPSGVGKLSDVTRAVEGVAEQLDVQLNSFVTVADVNKVKMYICLLYTSGMGPLVHIAREPLWRHLINYRCGTGHSVSFVGNVHEGPHALNSRNTTRMRPGMVVTDEPGVYETDLVGIRIENELVCVHRRCV